MDKIEKPGGEGEKRPKEEIGLAPNIASLICYIFLPITSIIFLVIEKENSDVRFHAWQGTSMGVVFFAAYFVYLVLEFIFSAISSFLGVIISFFAIIGLILFITLIIICMIKAYQGERWRVPYIGDFAAKKAGV